MKQTARQFEIAHMKAVDAYADHARILKEDMPETTKGKAQALAALAIRRASQPERINNMELPAGSPMYFYCISCGALAGVLPEDYVSAPPKLCSECAALKEMGWLE